MFLNFGWTGDSLWWQGAGAGALLNNWSRARSPGRLLRVLIRCRSFNAVTLEGRHGHVGDLGLESRVIAREPVMVVITAETLTHTFWVQARSRSPHCVSGDFLLPCVVSTVTLQRRLFFFLKNVLHVCLFIYLCARAHHSLHVEVRRQLAGVLSLLPLCGFRDQNQVVRLRGKYP